MREEIDFRIPEKNARGRIPADVGVRLGDSVRRVVVSTQDPLFAQIRNLDREFRARGEVFFTGWIPHRYYSQPELERGELFRVWPRRDFQPAGEECGTEYDESRACQECGAGAVQKTPLFLDSRRTPRRLDFARTIAGELVVSASVREVFLAQGLTGAEFEPVRKSDMRGQPSSEHFQLSVVGPMVELAPGTRAGSNIFDESSYGHCPRGHIAGLNLLSECQVERRSLVAADVMVTTQMFGVRRGLLRPRPMLLLTPRARRAIEEAGLTGLVVEVAHVV